MLPLLLLLLVAETTSLNPLCDQRKGQAPENVNAPADYIFIFDQGLIQDKSERWRYVVKAMTCNLMEHTDVNLAVAAKKGDNIDFDQWEKPSRFESRLLRVKGNAGGDESTCPTASSLYGLPIEPNRPTHLVVLVDTDRADDCVDLDTDFSRIFHNTEIVLDRIHIGAPLASENLKITQHWGDIDTAVSTLPDDHSFANLANQDTHESLQDQISNWIAGRLPQTLRRSLKNESTPIVVTIDSTVDVTTADYSTTENLTTIETITVASSNGTGKETLETTVVADIGAVTDETTTMDPETNSTWENGTTTTQEGPAEMVITGRENGTTEANKTPMSTPTLLMNTNSNSTASSTTEKAGSWTSEAWQWIAREYILLLLLLLALILIIVNIILLCCVICTCRKRDKERRGKNKYQSLGGNLYSTKEKEEKTLSGSDSDTVVVPVPEEKRALLDEISDMQATQTNTDNVKKDTISPATQPLSLPLPSTEPPSSMRHDKEAAPENPLPVPHPAEGAVDPYSPPLPSPFEVRHSDVALTPVRTVSSFTQRGPQRDQQPPTVLLQKKAASPKRPDVFDL